MIELVDVCKAYVTRGGQHVVLDKINLQIQPGEKVGILGRNGAGKSTLIRILSGAEMPDSGEIKRSMSISWPLAFSGAFQGSLTGLDNLKFICRVYGSSIFDKVGFVRDFSELGEYFWEPVKSYSSGMRSRLAFAISMAVDFDCFLIDEIIAVGDSRFHEKCKEELFVKRKDRAFVIVSHDVANIRQYCTTARVLTNGSIVEFDDVDAALNFYSQGGG
jgi:capsular polysaccharide transport system ATP-binding protein